MSRTSRLKNRDGRRSISSNTKPRHSSKLPSINIQSKTKDLAKTSFLDQYFPVSRNFFLLIGPGGQAFGKKESASFGNAFSSAKGNYCKIVGDGESSVSLSNIRDCFEEFVSVMSQNSPRAKECCIVVCAHGLNNHGFRVRLDDRSWCSIEELFKIFSSVKDRYHLSIFITSCYGGAAHKSLKVLPIGSSVATISDADSMNEDI